MNARPDPHRVSLAIAYAYDRQRRARTPKTQNSWLRTAESLEWLHAWLSAPYELSPKYREVFARWSRSKRFARWFRHLPL